MTTKLSGGHSESVFCLEVKDDILISGGEGGELCLWDLHSETLVNRVCLPDESCSSICVPTQKSNGIYASFGDTVKEYDLRRFDSAVVSLQPCEDEINQIVLNDKEEFLAACDDSGKVKVYTVRAGENKVFKTLRNRHTNICSTVTFRPGKPWDLISGGFDCHLIHWDFGKLKCLNMFNLQEMLSDSVDSVGYMLNPPFVHHMNLSPEGTLLGCGLGNGGVMIIDTSKRHLKQKQYFQIHGQGVSQFHFVDGTRFVTGSNDEQLIVGDLSVGSDGDCHDQHEPAVSTLHNGHGATAVPVSQISGEDVTKHKIDHKFKINWLKPFLQNGLLVIAAADQRSEITLYNIS